MMQLKSYADNNLVAIRGHELVMTGIKIDGCFNKMSFQHEKQ